MTEARTLCCPICGRELGVPPHKTGAVWDDKQKWLIRRLRPWLTLKQIGRVFNVTDQSIEHVIRGNSKRR